MVLCKQCNTAISISYKHLGMSVLCPGCSHLVQLSTELNTFAPVNSGYEIRFDQFLQLINEPGCNSKIIPLIEKRYACKTSNRNGTSIVFTDADHQLLPFEFLHLSIQDDKRLQKELYYIAMDAWR